MLARLKAFLSDRTQVANISGYMSDTVSITSGVPQGSVLAPTLFLLFINDTEDVLFGTSVHMKLFADDVKLYTSFGYSSCDLQVLCVTSSRLGRNSGSCELPGTSAVFTDLVIVSWIVIMVIRLMATDCLGQTRLVIILELCLTTS